MEHHMNFLLRFKSMKIYKNLKIFKTNHEQWFRFRKKNFKLCEWNIIIVELAWFDNQPSHPQHRPNPLARHAPSRINIIFLVTITLFSIDVCATVEKNVQNSHKNQSNKTRICEPREPARSPPRRLFAAARQLDVCPGIGRTNRTKSAGRVWMERNLANVRLEGWKKEFA